MRYDGPHSMALDRPSAFALTLLQNVALWEVPRLAVAAFVRWRHGGAGKKAKGVSDKEKEFVACAPSYVLSLVHAVVISALGLRIMGQLWHAPVFDKFYINEDATPTATASFDLVERSNWLFFGYMVDDLLNVLVQYPRLGKMDMVAHHCVFIACAILAGSTQTFLFPFSWLLAGELSTPLLAVRWFVRQLAAMQSPSLVTLVKTLGLTGGSTARPPAVSGVAAAAATLEDAVARSFMAVFFVVRVLVYGGGLTHTLRHLFAGNLRELPTGPTAAIVVILLAGAGLNAHWFRLMLVRALGLGRRGKGKEEKKA